VYPESFTDLEAVTAGEESPDWALPDESDLPGSCAKDGETGGAGSGPAQENICGRKRNGSTGQAETAEGAVTSTPNAAITPMDVLLNFRILFIAFSSITIALRFPLGPLFPDQVFKGRALQNRRDGVADVFPQPPKAAGVFSF
jgi:hypothetical protein